MVVFPHAKINLGLSVLRKRQDGFHDIETVLVPVMLCDALECIVAPDGKFSFSMSGYAVAGAMQSNLCYQAWAFLKRDFGLPEIKMHLHKAIPMGAGLGGGSADGAFTLKMLNRLFDLQLTDDELETYARPLGSDCAFFVGNGVKLASGKGDVLEPVEPDLSGYFLVVAKPDIHIDTGVAYGQVKPSAERMPLKEIIKLPAEAWKGRLKNDFEEPVFRKFPLLADIKARFYEADAVYASMTGSGSAVYGLFKGRVDLRAEFPGYFYWSGSL